MIMSCFRILVYTFWLSWPLEWWVSVMGLEEDYNWGLGRECLPCVCSTAHGLPICSIASWLLQTEKGRNLLWLPLPHHQALLPVAAAFQFYARTCLLPKKRHGEHPALERGLKVQINLTGMKQQAHFHGRNYSSSSHQVHQGQGESTLKDVQLPQAHLHSNLL